jgi:hypothetical protein
MWNVAGYHSNVSYDPSILTGIERLEFRRDGFASLRLSTTTTAVNGTALTKPVTLPHCPNGRPMLLVNADLGVGESLIVHAVSTGAPAMMGEVIGNGVRMAVKWRGGASLPKGGSHEMSFKFWLGQGMKLYAWQLRCNQEHFLR